MPPRTNEHQQIVYLVKQHIAPPGAIVTESKMLFDRVRQVEREVDVVIEHRFADEDVVLSVEVIAWSRKASITWVEQQISKHSTLPTSKLVLVSWSGFSDSALRAVQAAGGRVVAVTPERVNGKIQQLYIDQFSATPTAMVLITSKPDGTKLRIKDVAPDAAIYLGDDKEQLCIAKEFALDVLNKRMAKELGLEANRRDDKEQLDRFTLVCEDFGHHDLYVRQIEPVEFHKIEAWIVEGDFKLEKHPLTFEVLRLGDTVFGRANTPMFGSEAVWVLTNDEDRGQTKISWRAT